MTSKGVGWFDDDAGSQDPEPGSPVPWIAAAVFVMVAAAMLGRWIWTGVWL